MSVKRKVLIVGSFKSKEYDVVGGIARSCDELMASAFSTRFNITTVDSTQRSNPPPGVMMRGWHAIFRLWNFLYMLLKNRPEGVVLFFSLGLSFYEKMLMGWLAKAVKVKVFLFPRAGGLIETSKGSKTKGLFVSSLFRCGDVFLAQGETWKKFAMETCNFDSDNTYIVPNWTASNKYFEVGAEKIQSSISGKDPVIIFVGWLETEKGIRELLQACKTVADNQVNFRCRLAGDGSQRSWVEEYIKENRLDDKVECMGWLIGEQLDKLYREADIFVLPSWKEGMPNSLIEAMSFGLCPVVTGVGIIPDFVVHGVHGYVIPPHAPEKLSDALLLALQSPEERHSLANEAYLLSKQFDKNRVIPYFCDIIENNLSK